MAVSPELARIYASAPADDRMLETLEIHHSLFSAPGGSFFITRDADSFTATLETGAGVRFDEFPFIVRLPSSGDNGFQDISITVSNVSKMLVDEIEAAHETVSEPITFVYRAYAESDLTTPGYVLPKLSATEVSVDGTYITVNASLVDLVNRQFPNQLYTPLLFPMLGNIS